MEGKPAVNERRRRLASLMDYGLSPYHLSIICMLHAALTSEKLSLEPAKAGASEVVLPPRSPRGTS